MCSPFAEEDLRKLKMQSSDNPLCIVTGADDISSFQLMYDLIMIDNAYRFRYM